MLAPTANVEEVGFTADMKEVRPTTNVEEVGLTADMALVVGPISDVALPLRQYYLMLHLYSDVV